MDRPHLLNRRSVLGMGAAAAAALVTPGCSRGRSQEPAPAGPARFATGNAGGVYATYGAGLAKLVTEVTGVQMSTIQTDGSVQNLRMLAAGTADVGFSLSDSALDAWDGAAGTSFAKGALRFTALARTYDNYVHVVVPMSSDIFNIGQLTGKDVSIGPVNSGTRVVAERILQAAGVQVRKRNYSLEQAVKALQAKAKDEKTPNGIDALIWSGGLPTKPIQDLQSSTGFRLVDIGTVAEQIALKRFGGYVLSSIPPSVYQLASSVPTLAVPNYLLARRGLSDSWAWWTVNTMFRRQTDLMEIHPEAGSLDARSAIATMPIPLHPAAERWYKNNHI